MMRLICYCPAKSLEQNPLDVHVVKTLPQFFGTQTHYHVRGGPAAGPNSEPD